MVGLLRQPGNGDGCDHPYPVHMDGERPAVGSEESLVKPAVIFQPSTACASAKPHQQGRLAVAFSGSAFPFDPDIVVRGCARQGGVKEDSVDSRLIMADFFAP
jgi:hypothetical protein